MTMDDTRPADDLDAMPMANRVGPPDVPPPTRTKQLLTSWKLWTFALVLAVVAIAVSIGMRGYQRYQALKYLDDNHCTYELTAGSEWITDWFGERAKGLRGVDSISLSVVSDVSLSRISLFGELRRLTTISWLAVVTGASGEIEGITDRGVEALKHLSQLESMTFGCRGLTDAQLAEIFSVDMPLVYLEFEGVSPARQALRALSRIPTLRTLKLAGLSRPSDEDFRGLDPFPILESLDIDVAGPESALWLSQLTHLRQLRLASLNVDRHLLQAISQLKELESLRFSDFGQDVQDALPALVDLPRLESLEVPTNAITWESLEILKQMPSLKRIEANAGDIDDPELREAVEREWELETSSFFGGSDSGGGFF